MDLSSLLQTSLIPEMEKGNKAKKEKEKSKKSGSKAAVRYKLPVTIHSNYVEPVVIEGEGLPAEMTENEILKEVRDRHECFRNFSLEILGEQTMLLVPQTYNCVKKGILKVTDGLEVRFGDSIMDISAVLEGKNEVAYEKLIKYACSISGTGIDLLHEEDTITLLYSMDGSGDIQNLKFPVTVAAGFNNIFSVQEDEFREFVRGLANHTGSLDDKEDEDGELVDGQEGEDTENSTEDILTINNFIRYVESKEPTYKGGHGQLYINEKNNFIRALYKKKFQGINKAEKKETLYPTDVVLSLVYEKIQLEPGYFDGKKEATEREIQKFLEKDRPEYSKERTRIEYDKKNNLIIATLSGGKRGFVSYVEEDGIRYRVSETPFMYIKAAADHSGAGRMVWKLPKIPYHVLGSMCDFFERVYRSYGTESLVSLMWSPEDGKYLLHVPRQAVSPDAVEYWYDYSLQKSMWILGTFHSHGRFRPQFSYVDDENEKADGIYGVAGNFDDKSPRIVLRAGTGGIYLPIHIKDVFEGCTGEEGEDLWTSRNIASLHTSLKMMGVD